MIYSENANPMPFPKLKAFFLATLFMAHNTMADTYYFSSSTGHDENTGLSIKDPLKDINKISALALKPGDEIRLAQTDTFYGAIILKKHLRHKRSTHYPEELQPPKYKNQQKTSY